MPQFLRLNRCIPPPILLGKRPVQLHHVPLNRRPIPIHLTVLQLDPISLLSRYHAAKLREVVSAAVLTQVYAREKREFVFATMRSKFDDDANPTFGALVLRRNATADSLDRYV